MAMQDYLNRKVFSNLVPVFNQWAVSNKMGSMNRNKKEREMRKIEQWGIKRFNIEQIVCLSDVATRLDFGDRMLAQDSEQMHGYIDEIPFAAQMEMERVAKNKIGDEGIPYLTKQPSLSSMDDAGFHLFTKGLSRSFSNFSDDWAEAFK